MIDGYYLSTYLHIDPLAHVANFSIRHDQNISLWRKMHNKIELIHYWELERISGIKKQRVALFNVDRTVNLINHLLGSYNLSLNDMVEVWGTPQISTTNDYHSLEDYKNLTYHSIAHLFSGILLDTEIFYNHNIIGLAVDNGPDYVVDTLEGRLWYTGCVVRQGEVDIFPIESPGPLWAQCRSIFHIEEGSLMALASASKSVIELEADVEPCVDEKSRESLMRFIKRLTNEIERLSKGEVNQNYNSFDLRFSENENIISMVMKIVQDISQKIMRRVIDKILHKYNLIPQETYLSLSGGYALNCPSNSFVLEHFGFKGLLTPPCANDGGQSLGIALYAFYKKLHGQRIEHKFEAPYYGDSDDSLERILMSGKYLNFVKGHSNMDIEQMIIDIEEAPIVWFNGRAEIGPRALGNRSILADPRNESAKVALNAVKQRQWWRPIAPVVMEHKLSDWFEDPHPSPFMLQTFLIRQDKTELIPAVIHLDRSARIQSVNIRQNRELFLVLEAFDKKTNIPMLCNTSLNDRGEPIINTIEEAFNFCLRKKIRVGYFNGKRICFNNFNEYWTTEPLVRNISFFKRGGNDEEDELIEQLNPYHLDTACLNYYLHSSKLQTRYNLKNEQDAGMIKKIFQYAKKLDQFTISPAFE